MLRIVTICAAALIATTIGCGNADLVEAPRQARADLINSKGETVGSAVLTEMKNGVDLSLTLSDLPPGEHGLHIHENGKCTPPDFQSAGGHLALPGQQHGFDVEGGPHLGDLRNVTVPASGTVKVDRTVDGANLGQGGDRSLLDRSIVIHAGPDDYTSQPSGDSGPRIACGVIQAGIAPVEYPVTPIE